jgi:hypothetical protein
VCVTIRHNDGMILCTKIRLHTLSVQNAPKRMHTYETQETLVNNGNLPLVDMPSGLITPDKANGLDIGVVAYPINGRDRAVHNIQHAVGQACSDTSSESRYTKRQDLEHLLVDRAQLLSLRLRDPSQTA